MNGAIVDSLVTSFRRTGARKRGAHESGMRYVRTKAGQLRVVGTGQQADTCADAGLPVRHRALRRVDPQVITFSGCGHFPNLERNSEYVNHVQQF